MKKYLYHILFLLLTIAAIMTIQSCYPIGEGGAIFFLCGDCALTSTADISVYVDDSHQGDIQGNLYFVACDPDKDGSNLVNYTGKAGEHTFTVKSASGSTLQQGTFTITKQKLVKVQLKPSGCSSAGGGGGGGGTCNYTSYSGAQNCSQSGSVAVSSTKCCSASAPYWCSSTGYCYTSCSDAVSAGCGSIVYGTGQTGGGGGGGGTCNWNSAPSCVSVILAKKGTRCGDPTSMELTLKNVCSSNVKMFVCLQRTDGTWSGLPDGTFNTGMAPGETCNWYVCKGTGTYKVYTMPASTYAASSCSYPTCN